MIPQHQLAEQFRSRYPQRLLTIDSYTAGEPTRLIVGGLADPPGNTMADKRQHFMDNHDHVRQLLTKEPRGHRGMLAAFVTAPVTPGATFGLIYMDTRRYPYLCGHATIGAVTSLIELGAIPVTGEQVDVVVDTPSGIMPARAYLQGNKVAAVAFEAAPSFVYATGQQLDVPEWGWLEVDTVCVGGFFVMIAAEQLPGGLAAYGSGAMVRLGMQAIAAANAQLSVRHPERPEVTTVDVAEIYAKGDRAREGTGRVIYGESHIDRSPCGTGTAAKLTLLHARWLIKTGEVFRNTGPLGTVFEARVVRNTNVGQLPAVVVEIKGAAHITGCHEFVCDAEDPFPEGFLLAL